MTEQEVVKKIEQAIRREGGQTALARKWGCSQAYISKGLKYRPIPDRLCALAGIAKQVVYTDTGVW